MLIQHDSQQDYVYTATDLPSLFAWPQVTTADINKSPRGVFDRWTQNLKVGRSKYVSCVRLTPFVPECNRNSCRWLLP